MLRANTTKQFEKDKKKAIEQGKDLTLLFEVIEKLIQEKPLDPKYCDHNLKGEWKGFRDCHVKNDWVLIYKVNKSQKQILFARLGTHSELFK